MHGLAGDPRGHLLLRGGGLRRLALAGARHTPALPLPLLGGVGAGGPRIGSGHAPGRPLLGRHGLTGMRGHEVVAVALRGRARGLEAGTVGVGLRGLEAGAVDLGRLQHVHQAHAGGLRLWLRRLHPREARLALGRRVLLGLHPRVVRRRWLPLLLRRLLLGPPSALRLWRRVLALLIQEGLLLHEPLLLHLEPVLLLLQLGLLLLQGKRLLVEGPLLGRHVLQVGLLGLRLLRLAP
mmetsp:Transcript_19823/g.53922  ORF Transcript_19823/g.53922 Transcript_19823/m.53922 type:complete len:237 (+) Transcript_19823:568-1278(+)